jgi:hypothetical protein
VRSSGIARFRCAAKIAAPLVPFDFPARALTRTSARFTAPCFGRSARLPLCRWFCWSGQAVSHSDFDSPTRQFSSCSSIPGARADSGRTGLQSSHWWILFLQASGHRPTGNESTEPWQDFSHVQASLWVFGSTARFCPLWSLAKSCQGSVLSSLISPPERRSSLIFLSFILPSIVVFDLVKAFACKSWSC